VAAPSRGAANAEGFACRTLDAQPAMQKLQEEDAGRATQGVEVCIWAEATNANFTVARELSTVSAANEEAIG